MENNAKTEKIKIMEVCGTHTMAIARYGLRDFFDFAELVSGPGCPVCVTPSGRLEQCVKLSMKKGVIITTFGDLLRVPAVSSSLEKEQKKGADIRVIYSAYDSVKIALENPEAEVIFAGAGFETTAPLCAAIVLEAWEKKIPNFSVFSMFKTVFPAIEAIVFSKDLRISGFLLPGNVAAVTGAKPFRHLAEKHGFSGVVAGFSEKDIVDAVNSLKKLIQNNEKGVLNSYKSAVSDAGNAKAAEAVNEVFELKDDIWRGFGVIKKSGFRIKRKYSGFDADVKFRIKPEKEPKDRCRCGDIMKGIIKPPQCVLFAGKCVPENPVGPCMVSSEGVCAAYYKYRKN